ncbi:MAG: YbjN domain-containing protein [Burkholderiales bacterium]|nr:YbjN domain-containing protein [Anaerolineae bacterium]
MFSNLRGRGSKPAATIQNHAITVEAILEALGEDVAKARANAEAGYAWAFRRGSATIEIYVSEQDDVGYLQVLSPIFHLPTSGLLPLYRRLLELNLQLTNASLGLYLDIVYVFYERQLLGLDDVEANQIIDQIARYADELDDRLVKEFGGRLYGNV